MEYRDDADGVTARDGQVRPNTTFPLFTPVMTTGNGWEYIDEPQCDPRAACMLLAAAVWKQDPGICLAELEAQVHNAVSELGNGARKVTISDHKHCVGRTDIFLDIPFGRHLMKLYPQGGNRGI